MKAVGLKGEVKFLPGPDFWPEILDVDGVLLVSPEGESREAAIERSRAKKTVWVLKLGGVDSIDEAENLIGSTLVVDVDALDENDLPRELRPFQAIGLAVRLIDGTPVGRVVDIVTGPAQDCLVVERETGRFLVPLVAEVVRRIDLGEGIVEIDPPEGLMEIGW